MNVSRTLFAAVALSFAFLPAASAQPVPPITPYLPDVAECRGVLSQEIVDIVNAAQEHPGERFERWRIENRKMTEASPAIECSSKLWEALQHRKGLGNVAKVPVGTEGFSLRPSTSAELVLRNLSASLGTNINPAGGVETYQGEMQIAVNPNNPLQLVAGANSFTADANCLRPGGLSNNGTQALYGSSDGGATWTYRCAPWPADISGVAGASQIYFFGSDPALAWDSSGRAYVAYMLLNCNSAQTTCGYSIVVARSSDAGQSWQSLGTVVNHSADSTHGDDKEMIAVDNSAGPASTLSHPGRIYVIWDDNNVERIAYSDNGTSWTTVILPTPSVGQYDIGGNVVVGRDGTVYAIWNRLIYAGQKQSGERLVFSKSVNGGATWTTPTVIASPALLSFGTNNVPPAQDKRGLNAFGSIAIDSNPASAYFGYLYVVYADFPSGTSTGTNIDTKIVRSTNGGTAWSTPLKVNDDAGSATQFFPWVAVDQSDGTVNVAWYDTRADSTNNRKTQVYYARSSNGATSFETNLNITDGGSGWRNGVSYADENSTENTSYNGNQYGDYAGIAAYNRQVHPFWTDSRSFFPTADTQSPSRKEDAGTAIVINCSAPSALTAPSVASDPNGVAVSWIAPAGWGTNATGGTYAVYRSTTNTFPGGSALTSNVSGTSYTDNNGVNGTTYYYFVRATNNCPGTALTPMSVDTTASASIVWSGAAPDATAPTGTITINSGAAFTNSTSVTLSLTATDATGVTGYFVSNSSTVPAAGQGGWTSVSSTTSLATTVNNWTIAAPDGSKTVYAWYKDAAGNVSSTAMDAITLDQSAPALGTLSSVAGNHRAWISWSGQSDAGSGIAGYKLVFALGVVPPADCSQAAVGTASPFLHAGLDNGQAYAYRLCTTDAAGNMNSGITGTATPHAGIRRNDFNGDGKSDLIWQNSANGEAYMWFLSGNTLLAGPQMTNHTSPWVLAATGDFNGDGKSDIAWRDTSTGDMDIWLMNGTTQIGSAPIPAGNFPVGWSVAGVGDFNGDGKSDLVMRQASSGTTMIWLMNGTLVGSGMFLPSLPNNFTLGAAGDFNGDGLSDIVWRNTTNGETYVWLLNSNTIIGGGYLTTLPSNYSIAAVGDFDNDGLSDIIWRNATNGDAYVWLLNSNNIIGGGYLTSLPSNYIIATSGDYDADGKSDIIWRNLTNGEVYVWQLSSNNIVGGGYLTTLPAPPYTIATP